MEDFNNCLSTVLGISATVCHACIPSCNVVHTLLHTMLKVSLSELSIQTGRGLLNHVREFLKSIMVSPASRCAYCRKEPFRRWKETVSLCRGA